MSDIKCHFFVTSCTPAGRQKETRGPQQLVFSSFLLFPLHLQILSVALDSTPFSFSLDLAALASRREYLNMEKWLHDKIVAHRDTIFQV